eukprot:IDg11665t1
MALPCVMEKKGQRAPQDKEFKTMHLELDNSRLKRTADADIDRLETASWREQ